METPEKKVRQPVSLNDLNRLLPWFGVMALVSGYLRTDIIYRHFDIPHWLYFNLEDYLTTSLGQILNLLLFSTSVTLLILFVIKNCRFKIIAWGVIIAAVAAGAYIAHVHSKSGDTIFWVALLTYLVAGAFINFPYKTDEKQAQELTLAAFLFITATLAVISLDAKSMIDSIKSHHAGSCMLVDLEFGDEKYADREFVIMGSNTRYFFLRDKETGRIEIVGADSLIDKGLAYYRKNDCP